MYKRQDLPEQYSNTQFYVVPQGQDDLVYVHEEKGMILLTLEKLTRRFEYQETLDPTSSLKEYENSLSLIISDITS